MGAMSRQLDQARRGEAEALSALYRQFLPGVFGYVAARVPDRVTAEDLTSEVFMKMVEGIGQLRASDEAGFAAWLLQIARITVAGFYRKRERLPTLVSLEQEDQEEIASGGEALVRLYLGLDPAEVVEKRDEWHTVVRAINALTEEQRQVLVGRLIMGYDVETVARMIGKKANAVKALQFRALHSLHRLLKKPGFSEQETDMKMSQRGGNP
ncbi:MAG TPA: sigma-70 family RNA polymerase sigma factor [Ktedonobacteraceae bacterium]|nr:sigma-70 family RNA polymerase sigma factor [Ktedonobacteraceae bacterium]